MVRSVGKEDLPSSAVTRRRRLVTLGNRWKLPSLWRSRATPLASSCTVMLVLFGHTAYSGMSVSLCSTLRLYCKVPTRNGGRRLAPPPTNKSERVGFGDGKGAVKLTPVDGWHSSVKGAEPSSKANPAASDRLQLCPAGIPLGYDAQLAESKPVGSDIGNVQSGRHTASPPETGVCERSGQGAGSTPPPAQ